jgi:hypothetical protein
MGAMMGKMKDLLGDEPGFDFEAYARSSDPNTSHKAAESLSDKELSRMETLAYHAALRFGKRGIINDELCDITGLPWQSITPRMRPLERKGKVWREVDRETGEWKTRTSARSGRQQDIWFAVK